MFLRLFPLLNSSAYTVTEESQEKPIRHLKLVVRRVGNHGYFLWCEAVSSDRKQPRWRAWAHTRIVLALPHGRSVTLGKLPAVYSVTDSDGLPSLEGLFLSICIVNI